MYGLMPIIPYYNKLLSSDISASLSLRFFLRKRSFLIPVLPLNAYVPANAKTMHRVQISATRDTISMVPEVESACVGDFVVGVCVGVSVGIAVGGCVGDSVGIAVGDVVGELVGDCVGDCVGDSVGIAVGTPVGDIVGDTVGDALGLTDGETLGDDVGGVGLLVGAPWDTPIYTPNINNNTQPIRISYFITTLLYMF